MNQPLQQTGYDQSQYERPKQKWVCGAAADGCPCDVGPDRDGRCPFESKAVCVPQRTDTGFRCMRPPAAGGPCALGPLPDGSCCRPEPVHAPCEPRLSLRARRNRFTFMAVAAAIGLLLVMLGGPWSEQVLSPGPLAGAHASLPLPAGQSHNCRLCHDGAAPSPSQAALATPVFALGMASNERCVTCHFAAAPEARAHAELPHGAAPRTLASQAPGTPIDPSLAHAVITQLGMAQDPHAALDCAACHKEHHGTRADLIPTDDACLSCHGREFASFNRGHPEFMTARPAAGINFDHASHAQPDHWGDQMFDCAKCHAIESGVGRFTTAPFERSCAGCHTGGASDHHGDQIRRIPAITVFQMLDPEDFDADPGVAAMMSLLLSVDAESAAAIASMDSAAVFADLEDEPKAAVMKEVAKLHEELKARDAAKLTERLAKALELTADSPRVAEFTRTLLHPGVSQSEKAATYQVTDHADPLLTQWLSFYADHPAMAAPSEGAAPAQVLRGRLAADLTQRLGKECMRCHMAGDRLHWMASTAEPRRWGYQKFDHRSHITALGGQSCAACHAFSPTAVPEGATPPLAAHGLVRQTKAMCAACHNPRTAQDSCMVCHNYHVTRP